MTLPFKNSRYATGHMKSKKRKGNLSDNTTNNTLQLDLNIALCSAQSPQPLCLVCPQILLNDVIKSSKLSRHFYLKNNKQTTGFRNFFNASLASHAGSETAANFTLTLIL